MKLTRVAAVTLVFMSTSVTATAATLNTEEDKLSYSIGTDLGKNFKNQGIEINADIMAKGIKDGMSGGKLLMTDDQMKNVLMSFQKKLIEKRTNDFNKQAQENQAKGEAFLSANKKKEGVVTLASGLQYKVIKQGSGAKPSKDDTVTVDYTGQLIDGKVFDSSEKAGKPATFKVSQVIPGWTEALQLMPAGSTWEIYVPSNLAYGSRSVGGLIGPNETLIFKVRLISVDKNKQDKK